MFIVRQTHRSGCQHESVAFASQRVATLARQHSGAVCVVTAEVVKNGCDPSVCVGWMGPGAAAGGDLAHVQHRHHLFQRVQKSVCSCDGVCVLVLTCAT